MCGSRWELDADAMLGNENGCNLLLGMVCLEK